jgi:CheY-like chemotaxis protein
MANILLVDDNIPFIKSQSEFLRYAGHSVSTAGDGKEAMDLVANNNFDIIITDLVMPEKEGIEIIIELSQTAPKIKIIAMSGGGRVNATDYLTLARQVGASDTLAKPFTGDELLAAVSRALSL